MSFINDNIRVQQWDEVRADLQSVNPRLAQLIDSFSPNSDFDFVRVTYRYGQAIMQNGILQLPMSKEETVPLNDTHISDSIRKRLDYSYIPTAVLLNKKAEVFYESQNRVMPTKIFNPGAMFGLWEIFDPPPVDFVKQVWSIVAGARSVFMLPKISNQFAHKKLQRDYRIHTHAPNDMLQHYGVFAEIVNSATIESSWSMDVLFFSKKWHEQNKEENINQLRLHHFWLKEAWRQSSNCRNNMSFDMAWELFSQAVTKRNMKPKPLIVNTLKHLLAIRDGFYPGYAPATSDESAPISLLTEAYNNSYEISTYPIIMEPVHLSKKDRPVYYSLQLPTLLEYAPGSHGKNVITDLRELKMLTNMLEQSLPEITSSFKFFHSEQDSSLDIKNSEELYLHDAQFSNSVKNFKKEKFSTSSPFLKGCIQISLTEDRSTPLLADAVF